MSNYLDSIKNNTILSNEAIVAQFDIYNANKSNLARKKIIDSTLRLVVKIASNFRKYGNFEDLIQEGNIGLLKAIDKFDNSLGVPWANYAAQWIRAYIMRYANNNQTLVKRGTSPEERKYYWKLNRLRAKLEAQGKPSDYESLGKEFGLSSEQVEFILSRSTKDKNLQDICFTNSEDSDSSEDVLDTATENIESGLIQHLADKDVESKMNFFIKDLSAQKRLIFTNRFMSDDYQTFAQLGEQLGVTRQRVQQIESELKKQFLAQIK